MPTSEKMATLLQFWRGPENGECEIEDIMYSTISRKVEKPEDIQKIVEMLIPSTCMYTLRAKKFENDADLKTEYYYKGKYKVQDIPQ